MLPEEVANYLGQKSPVVTFEVEKGAIRRYADAVGETNPRYRDEEYGDNKRYGTLMAPPGFFGWPVNPHGSMPAYSDLRLELIDTIKRNGYPRLLDGGVEYEFLHPVRSGDVLAVTDEIVDIALREGKSGRMVVFVVRTAVIDEEGKLVAVSDKTHILLRR